MDKRRGDTRGGGELTTREEPTVAAPGSEEKIAELARRVEQGQSLWHPGDAVGGPGAGGSRSHQVLRHLRGIVRLPGRWRVEFRRGGRYVYVGTFNDYGEA